jgi:hypothetical protein
MKVLARAFDGAEVDRAAHLRPFEVICELGALPEQPTDSSRRSLGRA